MQAGSVVDEPRVSVTTTEKAMQAVEFGKDVGTVKKVFWSQHVASVTRESIFY